VGGPPDLRLTSFRSGGSDQQGPGWPFEQDTDDPGGTTMVVLLGGGGELSWKLRHPDKPIGISATNSNFRMRWILSGRHRT
jgi:hypothetical protein